MEISSFQSYLIILFVVIIIISIFVFRQFLKTRSEELNLVKFEQKGLDSLTQAAELYEFGSIQIRKRLYSEATKTFLKAIDNYENEPDEAKAIINNALGFSYAAQNEFKKAIKSKKLNCEKYILDNGNIFLSIIFDHPFCSTHNHIYFCISTIS